MAFTKGIFSFNVHDDIDDKILGSFLSNRMGHGRRSAKKPSRKAQQSHFRNGGGWAQTLGGITILFGIPVFMFLSLSPDVHAWVRATISAHWPSESTTGEKNSSSAPDLLRQYRLPSSISKIAEVSEEAGPDSSGAASAQPSDFSRAISRLHFALHAYPNWKTEDVFRVVNEKQSAARILPCPFERIDGEQSMVLSDGLGGVSLARTLDRCAEAVEQSVARGRSAQ